MKGLARGMSPLPAATLQSDERPGTMQDSLPTERLRSIGWVSHPQGLL